VLHLDANNHSFYELLQELYDGTYWGISYLVQKTTDLIERIVDQVIPQSDNDIAKLSFLFDLLDKLNSNNINFPIPPRKPDFDPGDFGGDFFDNNAENQNSNPMLGDLSNSTSIGDDLTNYSLS